MPFLTMQARTSHAGGVRLVKSKKSHSAGTTIKVRVRKRSFWPVSDTRFTNLREFLGFSEGAAQSILSRDGRRAV